MTAFSVPGSQVERRGGLGHHSGRRQRQVADRLPNARLGIYPDANHGFLSQYPELFADHVNTFLNAA